MALSTGRRASLGWGLLSLMSFDVAAQACAASYEVGLGVSGHLAYELGPRHEPAGLLVELTRLAAARSGLALRSRTYPLQRLQRMLDRGELPVLGLRRWTPQRPEIEPLLVAAPLLWVRAEQAHTPLSELLADPRVVFGRLSTGTVSPWVDKRLDALPETRIERSIDPNALLRKLAVGRVQAVFSMALMQRAMLTEDRDWQQLVARTLPEAGYTVGGLQIGRRLICKADAERLRQALRTLRDDGSLFRLLQAELGAQAQSWMIWKSPAR